MKKRHLNELKIYCGSNSVLVVNKTGIFRLFCPFTAVCILNIEHYSMGQEITVSAVKMSFDFKLVYVIQGKGYYHSYFSIELQP